jgi:N-acetyl sugar amidotransferase
MKKVEYKMCSHCILDTNDDPDITFDDNGVCNYCNKYKKIVETLPKGKEKEIALQRIISEIKSNQKNSKYDVILGLSGGVDSSYLAYLCQKFELRPLIVHFDNGWNSELSVQNIYKIINKFKYDLVTYVVDWEEFKDIQLAYLKASVIDIEAITDHAIMATMYHTAKKYNIKYILSGFNYVGESIMIKKWVWDKSDWLNIKSILKQYGKLKLKTFPHLSFWSKLYYQHIYKIKTIQLLNYIDYNPIESRKILMKELDWKDYGGKHCESIFTCFYQHYILPKKFSVDKRKVHLSNLICAGLISRDEALKKLESEKTNIENANAEKEYVLKKLGLSEKEFESIMRTPPRSHSEFDSDKKYYEIYFKVIKILKPVLKPLHKIFMN